LPKKTLIFRVLRWKITIIGINEATCPIQTAFSAKLWPKALSIAKQRFSKQNSKAQDRIQPRPYQEFDRCER